jgi:hypothetical protein
MIKRVRVSLGSGTGDIAGVDNAYLVQYYRYGTTTAGSPTALTLAGATYNTTAGNISASGAATGNIFMTRNPGLPQTVPTGLTVKAKAATTACVIGTTTVQILDQTIVNGRAIFEWVARDPDDMWQTTAAGYFAVAITSPVVSQVFNVSVDFVI